MYCAHFSIDQTRHFLNPADATTSLSPTATTAYNEKLAARVATCLHRKRGVSQKKMFGGLSFLVNGHMACGVIGDDLVVRVDKAEHEELLKRKHARPMDFTGRAMRGFLYIAPEGTRSKKSLDGWVQLGYSYAKSLPPK